jgi:hypothetical protein
MPVLEGVNSALNIFVGRLGRAQPSETSCRSPHDGYADGVQITFRKSTAS